VPPLLAVRLALLRGDLPWAAGPLIRVQAWCGGWPCRGSACPGRLRSYRRS